MDDMLNRLAVLDRKLDNAVLRILDLMEKNNKSNEEAHEAIGRNIHDLRTEMRGTMESMGGTVESTRGTVESMGGTVESMRETMESMGEDLAKLTDMPHQLRDVNRRLNDIDINMGVR